MPAAKKRRPVPNSRQPKPHIPPVVSTEKLVRNTYHLSDSYRCLLAQFLQVVAIYYQMVT